MILCAGGDIHGQLDRFYADIAAFEESLAARFAHVLHVGDFGIWPDHKRVDRATAKHADAGDFERWLRDGVRAPYPTVFIKGNHEDFEWLDTRSAVEGRSVRDVAPQLLYLPNGTSTEVGDAGTTIRVTGIGGCFGYRDYQRPSGSLCGYARRHFTYDEVDRVRSLGPGVIDVLLLHDAPDGVDIPDRSPHANGHPHHTARTKGLRDAVLGTRPRVCFFGHHHARVRTDVGGVPCIGLNLVGYPGNLVAFEIALGTAPVNILGEWPSPHATLRAP